MRIACAVAYQGQQYSGWQKQANVTTVQLVVETALSKVADQPIAIQCAGRTDAGVHATHQVFHFDSPVKRKPIAWLLGTNTHLPSDIRLLWVQPTMDNFHARHHAMSRSYHYFIDNQAVHNPFYHGRLVHYAPELDAEKMHQAAQCLHGEHNFSSFKAASCQSPTADRYVFSISVKRHHRLVVIEITASAFLHHMVRNIVGSLISIGAGRQPVEWMMDLLAIENRAAAGMTAPAEGLYLTGVLYPDTYALPSCAAPHLLWV